jgi:ferredoxin
VDSPFDVLDIDADADDEAIERAYRERVKSAHPDHGGSVREFQRVRRAYEEIQAGWTPPLEGGEGTNGVGDANTNGEGQNGSTEPAANDPEPEPEGARVEYLDYEVIDDRGWDLGTDDLFARAAEAGLDSPDYGEFVVGEDETLLEAAESNGFIWPYACRGGACTNCAVAVVEGEMPMPGNHVLPPEMTDRGIRLSCLSAPTSEEAKVIYNVKHLPGLDDLRLPLSRFDRARMND